MATTTAPTKQKSKRLSLTTAEIEHLGKGLELLDKAFCSEIENVARHFGENGVSELDHAAIETSVNIRVELRALKDRLAMLRGPHEPTVTSSSATVTRSRSRIKATPAVISDETERDV